MSATRGTKERLASSPATWLLLGVAGFIGSHLTDELLRLGPEGHRIGQPFDGHSQIGRRSARALGRGAGRDSPGSRGIFGTPRRAAKPCRVLITFCIKPPCGIGSPFFGGP